MAQITLQQAATLFNISADTLLSLHKKKLIKGHKINHLEWLFSWEELEYFTNKNLRREFTVLRSSDRTNFSVVELFAGCGGMALGFENAGLQTKYLVEINQDCTNTLQLNRPQWNVIHEDIKQVSFLEYRDKIDIVAGGFPCQSFSYAGLGKGLEDTRGTLFFEFARSIQEIRPKIAIAENVRGLLSHQKGRTLSLIVEILNELGYCVTYKILSAQFLDVPQKRERLIIIATRKDLDIKPIFPPENNYIICLQEALKNCPTSIGVEYNSWKKKIMSLVPPGGNWRDLSLELQQEYMKNSLQNGGGRTGYAKRLCWDEPALTITCSPAQTQTERCHPEETRPLTVREYARIQSFPDDWEFTGALTAQYRQIGNAVPVNMAYHIGRQAIAMLRGESEALDNAVSQQLMIPGLDVYSRSS
jgi:DNA (cytosine-5)-methyltransferase 1